MKLNEIKCVLTTIERLDLVNYIIKSITEAETSFTCIAIELWLSENAILLFRAAENLGISKRNLDRILTGGINFYPITDRHKVKVRVYDIGNECIEEEDNTNTNIKLRLFLPELLEYEPEVLALGGGFWKPSSNPESDPRLKALKEIREKLKEQIHAEEKEKS